MTVFRPELAAAAFILLTSGSVLGALPCRALNPPKTPELQDRLLASQMRGSVFQLATADGRSRSGTATIISIEGAAGYFLTVRHNFEASAGFDIDESGKPRESVILGNGHARYAVDEVWFNAPAGSAAAIVDLAVVKATRLSGDPSNPVELAIGWGLSDVRYDPVPSMVILGYWITEPPPATIRTPTAMFERYATSDSELKAIFKKPPVPVLKPLDAVIIGSSRLNEIRAGDSGSIAYDAQGYGLGLLTNIHPKALATQGELSDAAVMIPLSAKQVRATLARIPPTTKAKQTASALLDAPGEIDIAPFSLSTLEWFMVINEMRRGRSVPPPGAWSTLMRAALCRPLNLPIEDFFGDFTTTVRKLKPDTAAEIAKSLTRVAIELGPRNTAVRASATRLAMAGFDTFIAQAQGGSTGVAYIGQTLTDYSLFLAKASEWSAASERVRLSKRALEVAQLANKASPGSPEPYDIAASIHQKYGNYGKAAAATSWKIEDTKPPGKFRAKDVADLQYLTGKAVGAPGLVTCDSSMKCIAAADVPQAEISKVIKGTSRRDIFKW